MGEEKEKELKDKRALSQKLKSIFTEVDQEKDSPTPSEPLLIGSTYEFYKHESHIEEGGLKSITKMKDQRTGRPVAVATLKEEYQKPEHINRFLREARILAELEHPNIVPLHELGFIDDQVPFFAMKLLKGDTLADIIKKQSNEDASDLNELLDAFYKVCDAIAYAHSKKIIHLDLKPENVQVSEFGEVLVLDWGFARHIDDEGISGEGNDDIENIYSPIMGNITRVGSVNGTPGYMSPEQIKGNRDDIDEQSDIYALGAILYSMITRHRPYEGGSVEITLEKAMKGETLTFPESIKRNTPKALIAITQKAMSPNKESRYSSVIELQSDIVTYMKGYATLAENADFIQLFSLLCKRNRKAINRSIIVMAIISAVIYGAITQIRENKIIAAKEKESAVKNLKLKTSSDILKSAKVQERSLRKEFKFKEALALYQKHRQDGYNHPGLWFRESLLQFGELNFKEAFECLDKIKEYPSTEITEYINDINDLENLKGYDLNNEDDLFHFLRDPEENVIRSHAHWSVNSSSDIAIEERLEMIKRNLVFQNPDISIEDLKLKYTSENGHTILDLSNNPGLVELYPIIGLPFDELNISHTAVKSLSYLMEYLNLSTKVLNVSSTNLNFRNEYIENANFEKVIARDIIFTAYNLKSTLSLKHLDLQDSGIYLRHFEREPKNLEYLNIANTKTYSLPELIRLQNLKTLIVDKQFNDRPTLAKLKERNVTIKVLEN